MLERMPQLVWRHHSRRRFRPTLPRCHSCWGCKTRQATKKYEQPAREYGPARHTLSSAITSSSSMRKERGRLLLTTQGFHIEIDPENSTGLICSTNIAQSTGCARGPQTQFLAASASCHRWGNCYLLMAQVCWLVMGIRLFTASPPFQQREADFQYK